MVLWCGGAGGNAGIEKDPARSSFLHASLLHKGVYLTQSSSEWKVILETKASSVVPPSLPSFPLPDLPSFPPSFSVSFSLRELCGLHVKMVKRQENDRGFPCIQTMVWESILSNQMRSYLKDKPCWEWCLWVDLRTFLVCTHKLLPRAPEQLRIPQCTVTRFKGHWVVMLTLLPKTTSSNTWHKCQWGHNQQEY